MEKKIFAALMCLLVSLGVLAQVTKVTKTITPVQSGLPVFNQEDVKGGYQVVTDLQAEDIVFGKKETGMIVWDLARQSHYQLSSSGWHKIVLVQDWEIGSGFYSGQLFLKNNQLFKAETDGIIGAATDPFTGSDWTRVGVEVEDVLTSTSAANALSANQGRLLNEAIAGYETKLNAFPLGTIPGQMLYWTGTVWELIDPAESKSTMLKIINGVPVWALAPGAPIIGLATAGNGSANVAYEAPASDGGSAITTYTATSTPGGFTGTVNQAGSGSITVAGLSNGTAYTFIVKATNAVGDSEESAASNSVTPATVPDAPAITGVTGGNGEAVISYTAPASDGGSAITTYTATSTPGGFTGTVNQAGSGSITVSGLSNGTAYTFTVKATNAVGDSEESAASNSVTPATVPDAPAITGVTGGNAEAVISYTAPASDGGSAITSYTAISTPGGFTGTVNQAGSGSITVSGLSNGTAYTFTVKATNTVGDSEESTASNPVIPATVPDAPAITGVTGGNGEAVISYTAPASDGGSAITTYTATSTPGGFTGTVNQAGSGSITVSGLSNGTAYTFTVKATNAVGDSEESAASNPVTTATVPDAPAITGVTGGNAEAVISYTAPASDGGSAITTYTAISTPGGFTGTVNQAGSGSITVSGLSNGTAYTFTVKATNTVGDSEESTASNPVIPATVPDAPAITGVTGGNGEAVISYTAPASDGGSAITSYTATSTPGGFTRTVNQAGSGSITVAGLSNGTAYTFTVKATNAVGDSEESAASNSVTPVTVPDAPAITGVTGGNGEAVISYTAPASDGGSAITSYTATSTPGGFTGTVNQAGSGSITVAGLSNGTAYTFTVKATNTVGDSEESAASNPVIPATVPDAPAITGVTGGNAEAVISYTAPASDGGSAITSYTAISTPGGFTGTVNQAGSGSITVSGLSNGTAYTFTVKATNTVGDSEESTASNPVIPATVPDAPAITGVTGGNGEAVITYTAPASDGGSAITTYTATSTPDGFTGTVNQAGSGSITVSGLSNGTAYTFTVKATNTVGDSEESTASNPVIPATVPDAPSISLATAGDGDAKIIYTAPASDGGSAITSYTATSTPGGFTGTVNQAGSGSITVAGLSNGTAYTFTVKATNAVGDSEESTASSSVTPIASVTSSATGRIWMDRNLGASRVATGSTDASSYGDLYQWGRGADGHQISTSGTITTRSNTDSPGVPYFIRTSSSPYDWRSTPNNNLWQGVNGTNNPCPSGYRVPTSAEWEWEIADLPKNTAGAYSSSLKLPLAPYRDYRDGSPKYDYGNYWSSTVSGSDKAYVLHFDSGALNSTSTFYRSYGFSVRCIQDYTVTVPDAPLIGTATATAGGGSASITYTAPVSNGGSEIIYYTATSSPGGFTGTVNQAGSGSITVTGLTNNVAYAFTVTATNSVGDSDESAASNGVIPGTVASSTGRIWMDRNLGASQVATSSTDAASYGDLYQWGRGTDGHQLITSATTTTQSSGDVPGHNKFITNGTDWRASQNDNLWQGVDGTNNPCPDGFRIPAEAEWVAEEATWSALANAGAIASVLKLPAPGRRETNGSFGAIGGTGEYWTTALDGIKARHLHVTNSSSGVYPDERSRGYSVRCIQDSPVTVPDAPLIGVATAGDGEATITYTAPADDGGAEITKYTVTSSPGGFTGTVYQAGSGSITVSGLANYTAYTFTITATNAMGISVASAVSNSVTPIGSVTSATGRIWMDRNLGASQVATSSTDAASYGDYYQWGRGTDGHQLRTSGTTETLSSGDVPGHNKFIISETDWRASQNDNLWQGVDGTNNPCPDGFRIPSGSEWEAEMATWSAQNNVGAFASVLKLPAAGTRYGSNASLHGIGVDGKYWAGTADGANSATLYFKTTAYVYGSNRSSGHTVRCIQDY